MTQVVGLVGYIASGKSTVANHFIDQDFAYYKLSDVIRAECKHRGLEVTRVNLQNIGNELREQFSGSVLAEKVLTMAKGQSRIVIDGIRNPEEIEFLRAHSDAFIIGIVAPKYVRLERYLVRAQERGEDTTTKASFEKINLREKGVGEDEHGQQVEACLAVCDYIIENNGSLDDLLLKCEELIQSNFFAGEIPEL